MHYNYVQMCLLCVVVLVTKHVKVIFEVCEVQER